MDTLSVCGVSRLAFQNFRSYKEFSWKIDHVSSVWVCGKNGTGKTNILEALSLLAPGRGLRSATTQQVAHVAKHPDVQRALSTDVPQCRSLDLAKKIWSMAFTCNTQQGTCDLHVTQKEHGRHILRDKVPLRRQFDVLDTVSVLWVTPVMDLLFREGFALRRRFLNRLLASIDPLYGPLVLLYEKALREWRLLVERGEKIASWPQGLQHVIAQKGTLLLCKRAQWLRALKQAIAANDVCDKPITLALEGSSEKALLDGTDVCQKMFLEKLEAMRCNTPAGHRVVFGFGPHVTKLQATYDGKPIEVCSTGEQKMVLLACVLGAAHVRRQSAPDLPFLLLLDELPAHLDASRINHILECLAHSGTQAWITSTDSPPDHATFVPHVLSL